MATAALLNQIANRPDVRPSCGGDGRSYLDFEPVMADEKNQAVVWEDGALLFIWTAPATYEVHVMVAPEGRGREAYRHVREGLDWMIGRGAERLWARIPNAQVRHLAAQMGFARCGTDVLDIGSGPVMYDLYQWVKPCRQQ